MEIKIVRYGWHSSLVRAKSVEKQTKPENVYNAFACILNEKNLLVNHDRWAMYRPTKLFPKLKTRDNVHLDFNPRLYLNDEKDVVRSRLRTLSYSDTRDLGPGENNNITRKFGLAVQAVLNFCDNREKDGGLQLVPGSHEMSYFEEWVRDLDDDIPDKSASFAIQPQINSINLLKESRCVLAQLRYGINAQYTVQNTIKVINIVLFNSFECFRDVRFNARNAQQSGHVVCFEIFRNHFSRTESSLRSVELVWFLRS